MSYRFDNMDAGESTFFSRQLEVIRPKAYDIRYPQLLARSLVPVDSSISPGAEVVTYRQYDAVGLAEFIHNYSTALPRADVTAREFTSKIRSLGSAYGYSIQEARAAMFAGVPLEQRKANAARKAIEEKLEAIVRTGSSADGLLGLLNQSNTTSFTVANGAAGSPLWSLKTPDEVAFDLHSIVNGIVSSTKNVEVPDTLLVPLTRYQRIATTRMGDGSQETILSYFLKTNPYVKTVIPWYALETAGGSSSARMVAYRRDPDALMLIIPQDFEQMPPQQVNMEVVTNCHLRCGGVVMTYPLSMSYGDGI